MAEDVRRFIAEGTHSTVYAVHKRDAGWHAVKVIDVERGHLPPHDVKTEVDMLRRIEGRNLVSLVDYSVEAGAHRLTFPLHKHTLRELLDCPYFCPTSPDVVSPAHDPLQSCADRPAAFDQLALGLASQLVNAVATIHAQGIGHRDIKPGNVLVSKSGVIKLCDFGTAVDVSRSAARTCQVGSGPYRAPELLFGDTGYDPLTIDLWTLGATLAEFWTPCQLSLHSSRGVEVDLLDHAERLPTHYERHEEEDSDEEERSKGLSRRTTWHRQTLFDAEHGEIGLAWSQMRVRGSPNAENWPEYESLADAGKLGFAQAPGADLARLLPMLSSTTDILEILDGLLQYSPSRRPSAHAILERESWREAINSDLSIVMDGFKHQGITEGL